MKPDLSHLDYARCTKGTMASRPGSPFGLFHFRTGKDGNDRLRVVACLAGGPEDPNHGWDHVSVSVVVMPKKKGDPLRQRTPTWDEMDRIKHKFWDDEETVVQFHPPEADKVNLAKNCLHMWKNTLVAIPCPPSLLVVPREIAPPETAINGAAAAPAVANNIDDEE